MGGGVTIAIKSRSSSSSGTVIKSGEGPRGVHSQSVPRRLKVLIRGHKNGKAGMRWVDGSVESQSEAGVEGQSECGESDIGPLHLFSLWSDLFYLWSDLFYLVN